jgi:hypothetical protein
MVRFTPLPLHPQRKSPRYIEKEVEWAPERLVDIHFNVGSEPPVFPLSFHSVREDFLNVVRNVTLKLATSLYQMSVPPFSFTSCINFEYGLTDR